MTSSDKIGSVPVDLEFINNLPSANDETVRPYSAPKEVWSDDFATPSKIFWRTYENGTCRSAYDSGYISGTFNTSRPSFDSLFNIFINTVKNMIQSGTPLDKKNTSDLNLQIRNMELAQQLLAQQIKNIFGKEFDGEELFGYCHGALNNYIKTNMKKG